MMHPLPVCLNRVIAVLLLSAFTGAAFAQQPAHLTIQEVYRLSRENYPLVKQKKLIAATKAYSVSNAAKGYLPVFSVNGQATYQSAVTSLPFKVPIAGFSLQPYSKDQYKLYGEADQTLYDGGVIKVQQQTAEATESIQQQSLETELYALYERLNQLYFGILLINAQLKQNELLKQDIQNGIDKLQAMIANGVAYKSSVNELSAQLLQADQSRIQLQSEKRAYLDILQLFIHMPLDETATLETPAVPSLSDSITRPEVRLYNVQQKTYDLQNQLLKAQLRPRLSLFVQGGYGRPALNLLSNNFDWYYLGGLRLNWNFGGWYTLKNQQRLLDISKQTLNNQQETFLFNTQVAQKQQYETIQQYAALVKTDNSIIALRESVKNTASAQLENGVLSAHDYINQVIAADQARQNQVIHQVELLQSQFNYQQTTGNIQINN